MRMTGAVGLALAAWLAVGLAVADLARGNGGPFVVKHPTGDPAAKDKVRRYRHRPGEELYDVSQDRYEWNNLAGDPKLAAVKAELKAKLASWMKNQGDAGQQTELEAFQHQNRNRNRKNKKDKKTTSG